MRPTSDDLLDFDAAVRLCRSTLLRVPGRSRVTVGGGRLDLWNRKGEHVAGGPHAEVDVRTGGLGRHLVVRVGGRAWSVDKASAKIGATSAELLDELLALHRANGGLVDDGDPRFAPPEPLPDPDEPSDEH